MCYVELSKRGMVAAQKRAHYRSRTKPQYFSPPNRVAELLVNEVLPLRETFAPEPYNAPAGRGQRITTKRGSTEGHIHRENNITLNSRYDTYSSTFRPNLFQVTRGPRRRIGLPWVMLCAKIVTRTEITGFDFIGLHLHSFSMLGFGWQWGTTKGKVHKNDDAPERNITILPLQFATQEAPPLKS